MDSGKQIKKEHKIDTAGASPHQTNPEHILKLDMVGTGYAVDAFGKVMARGVQD